jgi:hypothetical protein
MIMIESIERMFPPFTPVFPGSIYSEHLVYDGRDKPICRLCMIALQNRYIALRHMEKYHPRKEYLKYLREIHAADFLKGMPVEKRIETLEFISRQVNSYMNLIKFFTNKEND